MNSRTLNTAAVLFIFLPFAINAACHLPASSTSQSTVSKEMREIVEAEAIQLAEDFIQKNGYTDLPPTTDRTKISFENIEWESDIEGTLRFRHDTLERKAYGISYHSRRAAQGWTVVFRYRNGHSEHGRAVTMGVNGENLLVEHVSYFLAKVDKIL